MPRTCPHRVFEPRQQKTFRPGSPWRKSYGREKWGLPPIRPHHGPGDKELHLKRIGWLYPIFRDVYFCHGLPGAPLASLGLWRKLSSLPRRDSSRRLRFSP